jgi:hypothetical protein
MPPVLWVQGSAAHSSRASAGSRCCPAVQVVAHELQAGAVPAVPAVPAVTAVRRHSLLGLLSNPPAAADPPLLKLARRLPLLGRDGAQAAEAEGCWCPFSCGGGSGEGARARARAGSELSPRHSSGGERVTAAGCHLPACRSRLPSAAACLPPASCLPLPPALPEAPELEFVQAHGIKAVSFSLPSACPAFSAAAAVAPAGFWADQPRHLACCSLLLSSCLYASPSALGRLLSALPCSRLVAAATCGGGKHLLSLMLLVSAAAGKPPRGWVSRARGVLLPKSKPDGTAGGVKRGGFRCECLTQSRCGQVSDAALARRRQRGGGWACGGGGNPAAARDARPPLAAPACLSAPVASSSGWGGAGRPRGRS